jgi:cytochrome P450
VSAAWSWSAAALLAVLAAVSLPSWLPGVVVALRVRIFALVNGDEGIPVPGRLVGADEFKRLYADPAADGRSRGAALSDLFWYWLAPGPEVHQEHLEPGPRYDDVARTTRRTLARLRRDEWAGLVARCADRELDRLAAADRPGRARAIRLRDAMMPLWAAVYYELVFGEPCPDDARALIVGNADDVVSALKCTRLRHMGRRDRLTRYLRARIAAGAVPHALPAALTEREQAYYLQGTYFNTAVVQMSEAMAHLLLALAARPELQRRLRETPQDTGLLDRVIDETLRVYPLFGVAHRITSADIALGEVAIPAGSVLLFNYPDYHHAGAADAADFDPDRWLREHPEHLHHIPFGVSANRPCPARGIAPLTMRIAAEQVLRRYALATAAGHTRSLPNRGPCLLLPLDPSDALGAPRPPAARLALQRLRDRWEDVWRSVVQLVLGTYMVWDARRLRLCRTHFAAQEAGR